MGALAELGGLELAVLTGAMLGASPAGAAVVLDGFAVSLAALLVVRLEPRARASLVAGQHSRERGHALIVAHPGCEPLRDRPLGPSDDEAATCVIARSARTLASGTISSR